MSNSQTASDGHVAELWLFALAKEKLQTSGGALVDLCAGAEQGQVWGCAFSPASTSDFISVSGVQDIQGLWDKFAHGVVFGAGACLYWRWADETVQCALICEEAAVANERTSKLLGEEEIKRLKLEKAGQVEIRLLGLADAGGEQFWEARIPRRIMYADLSGTQGQRPVLNAVCYRAPDDSTGIFWTRYVSLRLREEVS